jgi:hypothetical protein
LSQTRVRGYRLGNDRGRVRGILRDGGCDIRSRIRLGQGHGYHQEKGWEKKSNVHGLSRVFESWMDNAPLAGLRSLAYDYILMDFPVLQVEFDARQFTTLRSANKDVRG